MYNTKLTFMKHFTKFALLLMLGMGLAHTAMAQIVGGGIKDAQGQPVIGASVTVDGTTLGVTSEANGRFSLNVPDAKNAVLTVSFIGYATQSIPINGRTHIDIVLQEDALALDDVVVVGYGTMKKSDVTGSVSSVSAEDIAARGTLRLEDALQGSVPGVSITQSNSRANGGFDILIRGQASINKKASPLYVIDGVVFTSMDMLNPEDIERVDVLKDASSTAIYGSRASAGVIMITTKGAKGVSGKAQQFSVSYDGYYGIKKVARFPELMDTDEWMDYRFQRYTELDGKTYDGSKTKGVDADGHPHFIIKDANIITAFGSQKPDGSSASSHKETLLFQRFMNNDTYDWSKQVLRTAAQQNHFISANGATETTSYRLGMGYQSEENVFIKNDYERINLKGAFDSKFSKVVEGGMSVNLVYANQNDFTTEDSSNYSPYHNAFVFSPILTPYDENGNFVSQPGKYRNGFTSTYNPLLDFTLPNAYVNETRKFHVFGNMYLRFNLYDGLKFTTTLSPNFYHGRQGIYFGTGNPNNQKDIQGNPLSSAYFLKQKHTYAKVVNTDRLDWTWDNQIDYNKTWGDHSFNAMGLFSMWATQKEDYTAAGKDISDDKLTYHSLGKAGGDKEIASSFTEASMVSVATRLNYSYKGKYMATATLRADGSSRFAKENRWGVFPSAAVAWRMSEENFLKSADWLDNLKLRLSYGVTGNNNVDNYVTASSAAGPSYSIIEGNEVQGYYPNGLIDMGLVWEKVKEFDFGVDFSVFNSRINLTADVYRRLSDGQIMDATVPLETGESSITTNIGAVRNAGVELGLQFGVIRSKNFTWNLNVNFSRNWSKIKELPNGDDVSKNWFIGERLNVLRDYKHTDVVTNDGVTMHTKDGDVHYMLKEAYEKFGLYEGTMGVHDWNNDGKITDDDKQIYGCTDPKWTGSISSSMYFKGFDFSFTIYTKQGQWSRSYFHETFWSISDRGTQKKPYDYYIPAGTPVIDHATGDIVTLETSKPGAYPYPNNSDNTGGGWFSNKGKAVGEGWRYHDTSFVKVKNICLGYTFPKSWMQKIHVKSLRLYVNVINPFCWTDYEGFDPEWASATLVNGGPASVTYQFGANLKF